MKNLIISGYTACIIIIAAVLGSCNKTGPETLPDTPQPVELTPLQYIMVESDNDFAIDIFRELVSKDESENLMISPLSISYALSMTANGASGRTRDSIMNVLRFGDLSIDGVNSSYLDLTEKLGNIDPRVVFGLANSVWVEKQFNPKESFVNSLMEWYRADVMDFDINDPGAPGDINSWISEKTSGRIDHVIDNIDHQTVMLLVNAIYFKGKWKYKFDQADTKPMPFYREGGATVNARMMNRTATLKAATGESFKMVELPYGQGNFVMDVILPDEGITPRELMESFDGNSLSLALASMTEVETELYMPRFKYEYKTVLNPTLSDMGMGIAFTPGVADFSNISDLELFIQSVIHQSFIENNEEGTEAAAVTVVTIGVTSVEPTRFVFKLDRPFIYLIREVETGSISFIGITGNPSVE